MYAPLNVLKPVAENIWLVDGPEIRFGPVWLKMPFPTRMTLIRLAGGRLFVHSPTALTPELQTAIEELGHVQWIVAPNRLHYWWVPQWHEAFPRAQVYLAPRVREQAGERITFSAFSLERDEGYEWDAELATLPVRGRYMTEVVFFHHATRTLVLTDFIENFEPDKLDSRFMRWLTRVGGAQDPDGQMPRDMRLTYSGQQSQLRAAVDKMIGWNPERILLAHGRWYDKEGTRELRRAFRWLRGSRAG